MKALCACVLGVFLATSVPAFAERPQAPTAPSSAKAPAPKPVSASTPRPPVRVRAFGEFGSTWVGAAESFDLVFGGHREQQWGGGVQVTNLWRGLFVQGSYSRTEWAGERVFVAGSDVVRLGVPVEAELNPLDVTVGWRFAGTPRASFTPAGKPRLSRRPVPYVGGGVGWMTYRESSPFSESGDEVDESKMTTHVLGGVEVPLMRWLHVGLEGRYRFAPDLVGTGGVSAVLAEDHLNGFAFGARLVIGK